MTKDGWKKSASNWIFTKIHRFGRIERVKIPIVNFAKYESFSIFGKFVPLLMKNLPQPIKKNWFSMDLKTIIIKNEMNKTMTLQSLNYGLRFLENNTCSFSHFFNPIKLEIYLTDFNKFTDILSFILTQLVRIN